MFRLGKGSKKKFKVAFGQTGGSGQNQTLILILLCYLTPQIMNLNTQIGE